MSNQTTLPAEQLSRHEEHHEGYLNGASSGIQETSASPPSYTISDPLSQFDPHMMQKPTEVQADVVFADAPPQLPFDDLIGGSQGRRTLPTTSHHQDSLEPPMPNLRLENQHDSTHKAEGHNSSQTPLQQSTESRHLRQRPELPHSSSSTPEARKILGKISELEEVDPFGESPFEAARRAQRAVDRDSIKSSSPSRQADVNGRFPSIKPGEFMPSKFLRLTNGPPFFSPPFEAPPFPPTVHPPIHPAHFPPNLHPPPQNSEPARTASQRQHPSQHTPQLPRSHSYHRPPSPSRTVSYAPRNPALPHSNQQPPPEFIRSHSQPIIPHPTPSQPIRSHFDQTALASNTSQYQYTGLPPSRRHTLNPRDGTPPGLASNDRYPVAEQPLSVPHTVSPPLHHPPAPLSRTQSQHHPPGPASRSQSQHHHPTPLRSALRDPRQSLPMPPQASFAPQGPSPVRLPSQNVPTPQALGIIHSPPMPSGSSHPDNSRPPRATPKPVMPQLLAPLEAQESNVARNGASQLQRSVSSSVTIGAQKGGFLAKTKSILRKRSSATGIQSHTDGAISFAPTMPNLIEENGVESKKLGKRLSRKK